MRNSNDGLATQAKTFERAQKELDHILRERISSIEQKLISNNISESTELIQVLHVYRWYDLALCKIKTVFGKHNPGPCACLKEFCAAV